jgi:hypothetical protein
MFRLDYLSWQGWNFPWHRRKPGTNYKMIDHLNAKIIACLEREPFSSAYLLAEALDVSPATVLSRLHNSLGMEILYLRRLANQLTDNLRQVRVTKCSEVLRALEVMQRTLFRHMITRDESWFDLEDQHISQWSVSGGEVSQKMDPAIGTAKFLLTAIWGVNGFHLPDLMLSSCRLNAQYFVEHVMEPLVQTVFPQGRTWYAPRLNVHLDNCRVHFSKATEHFSIDNLSYILHFHPHLKARTIQHR